MVHDTEKEGTDAINNASCGNCGRPATHSTAGGTINRCDRCNDL